MIQTESTPNPNSLKFLSERTISSVGTEEFQKGKTDNLNNSFIKELLDFMWNLFFSKKFFVSKKRR